MRFHAHAPLDLLEVDAKLMSMTVYQEMVPFLATTVVFVSMELTRSVVVVPSHISGRDARKVCASSNDLDRLWLAS